MMKPIPNPAEIKPNFCARLPGFEISAMKANAVEWVPAAISATTRPAISNQIGPATLITT